MKHDFKTTFLPILTVSELQLLGAEVKETLVNYSLNKKAKEFTRADLWNIQKQRRTITRRNYLRGY